MPRKPLKRCVNNDYECSARLKAERRLGLSIIHPPLLDPLFGWILQWSLSPMGPTHLRPRMRFDCVSSFWACWIDFTWCLGKTSGNAAIARVSARVPRRRQRSHVRVRAWAELAPNDPGGSSQWRQLQAGLEWCVQCKTDFGRADGWAKGPDQQGNEWKSCRMLVLIIEFWLSRLILKPMQRTPRREKLSSLDGSKESWWGKKTRFCSLSVARLSWQALLHRNKRSTSSLCVIWCTLFMHDCRYIKQMKKNLSFTPHLMLCEPAYRHFL